MQYASLPPPSTPHPSLQGNHDCPAIAPTVWVGSHAEHALLIFLYLLTRFRKPKAQKPRLGSMCSLYQGGNNTTPHLITQNHNCSVITLTVWLRSYASPCRTPPPLFFYLYNETYLRQSCQCQAPSQMLPSFLSMRWPIWLVATDPIAPAPFSILTTECSFGIP